MQTRTETNTIMRQLICLFVLVVPLLVPPVRDSLSADELTIQETRRLTKPLVDRHRVVGLSVGIIDGSRQFSFHMGEALPGEGPPDDQTIYEIGSISKVFTGVLLGIEAEQDTLYLLEKAQYDDSGAVLPNYQGQAINWLQLATHRSGLPRLPSNFGDAAANNPYASYDSTKAVEFLESYRLPRRPGTHFEYSNFAYAWLGHLLTKQDGASSYERLLQKRITRTLRMDDTVLALSDRQKRRLATPHSSFGVRASTWEFADLPGAGGIRSTTADMMTFMAAILDPSQISTDRRLSDGIEMAWKKHQASSREHFAMGLGWQIARDDQTRWHNGQTGGFHSAMFVNREHHIGVVVMTNTADAREIEILAEHLVRRLVGSEVLAESPPREIDVDLATMKRLEGRYELAPAFIFNVKVQDDRLMVGITNQPTQQIYAKREDRWFYKNVDAELEFDLPAIGPAASLELIQNGIRQSAIRIP